MSASTYFSYNDSEPNDGTRDGPALPNDRGFGAYGGVAVPYGDSFVYVGGLPSWEVTG